MHYVWCCEQILRINRFCGKQMSWKSHCDWKRRQWVDFKEKSLQNDWAMFRRIDLISQIVTRMSHRLLMMFCIDRNQPSISFIALAERLLAVVRVTTKRTFLINYLRKWAASNKWHCMKFRFNSFFLHYHIIHVEFIGRSNTIHLPFGVHTYLRLGSLHESVSIRQVVKSVRISKNENGTGLTVAKACGANE